jgi:transcriptional regulator of acetoin/glycerol metabolism
MSFQLLRHHALKDAFDWERFGKRLTKEIRRREVNIKATAEEMGMSRNTFYERMHGLPCSAELLLLLCDEFDLDPWDYFQK